jgi:hypothetical protein
MQDRISKSKRPMVRKQIFIEADQNRRLKAVATVSARSEGELIREAVDQWLAKLRADTDDWKAAWRQAAGMWQDRADLDQLFASRRLRRNKRRSRATRPIESGEQ